jgi:tetratricopeptide (TPR) repeat protein
MKAVRRGLSCALFVAGQSLAREPLESATPEARAERLRAEADRHFAAGDYRAALPPLSEGYALTHDARFLLNLGVTYHWLGECQLARDSYERYLQTAPPDQHQATARAARDALEPVCGRSSLRVDGAIAAPPRDSEPASPSTYTEAAEAAHQPERVSYAVTGSLISAGSAALVGAGLAGIAWSRSHGQYRDLLERAAESGQSWDGCCAEHGETLEAREARYRALTVGLGIGGVALLATGIVLWPSAPTAATVALSPSGVSVGGRF